MQTKSFHLLLEYWGCDASILNDLVGIEELMKEAARAADANIVGLIFKPFYPQGVSGVIVIEESHLSIHTWPEHGYASADLFTCGTRCKPEKAHEVLRRGLKAKQCGVQKILRGIPEAPYLKVLPSD